MNNSNIKPKTYYCNTWPDFDWEEITKNKACDADSHETAVREHFLSHIDEFIGFNFLMEELQDDEYIIISHDGTEWMAFTVAEIKATFECVTERVAQWDETNDETNDETSEAHEQ